MSPKKKLSIFCVGQFKGRFFLIWAILLKKEVVLEKIRQKSIKQDTTVFLVELC